MALRQIGANQLFCVIRVLFYDSTAKRSHSPQRHGGNTEKGSSHLCPSVAEFLFLQWSHLYVQSGNEAYHAGNMTVCLYVFVY